LEHVFFAWQRVAARLRAAKHILFLSDYDGTITPIVERPEMAYLSSTARGFLQALARQRRFTVGIISGRSLEDLKRRVSIKGIIYAGNHGLEMEGPDISFINPTAEETEPVLSLLYPILSKAMKTVRGVLVEDKGLSLSVHYRMVSDDETDEVKNILERVIATARSLGKVRIASGKKVYEIRPVVDWDKGKAISLLLKKCTGQRGKGETLPIFLGDDLTDEDGFKAINKNNGISIIVGEKTDNTAALYSLRSPAEVEELMGMMLEHTKKASQGV